MRADLIKARPDVVKAWLNAELDAQLFLADPKNAAEVIKMAKEQTTGFSERALWYSLYGTYPQAAGGSAGAQSAALHLHAGNARADQRAPRRSCTRSRASTSRSCARRRSTPSWTEQVLKERNVKAPIGDVKALPDAQAPK